MKKWIKKQTEQQKSQRNERIRDSPIAKGENKIQSILPLLSLNNLMAKTTRKKTKLIPAPPSKTMNNLKNKV